MNESKLTSTLKSKVDSRLQRIANVLLLNASFIDNLGLLNGKMGIAIFFYQYSRYTGSKIFGDYAGELIDEIKDENYKLYVDCKVNGTPKFFVNGYPLPGQYDLKDVKDFSEIINTPKPALMQEIFN